ncbi:GNAT family N-acetyltransferase [Sulfuricurvum sp.]|uniref:GNAT family N-acetyltransferase n=1 Tax=Sulfuricurvum sp. TaxID=2025608 RepID=UPI002618758F|nr:GNAT family N-acetyltransferase [Sulfuricurvum sp.]MDD3597262.1 GNAT family N-acetyltransferase [Sulfuricurvum sp.]
MIRQACPGDMDAMVALLGELFAIEDDFTIDPLKQQHGLERLLEDPNGTVLVAESGGIVVGMATMQRLVSTAMGEYVGLIEDVVVHETYRRQGIGNALIETLIAEADVRGYARLALGADRRNTNAIDFYRSKGFVPSQMGLMYRI